MKIQSSEALIINRRRKLLKTAMLYLILFSLGVIMYFGTSGNAQIFERILGNYTAGTTPALEPLPKDIKKALNKFATLKAADDANLPSCENYIITTNFDGSTGNKCLSSPCQAAAKDGSMSGYMKLYLCQERPNMNLGCTQDSYMGAIVDTLGVKEFPMLEFLSQTKIAELMGDSKDNNPFKTTQPFCFYNMFRSFGSFNAESNPLSFYTDFTGPVYFNSDTSKIAVIPYERLGTAAQCWGIDWGDFDRTARFDVKAFYKEFIDTGLTAGLSSAKPESEQSKLIDKYKSTFKANMIDFLDIKKVSEIPDIVNKTQMCDNLPGGPIKLLNESKKIYSQKEYEVTRKIFEFTKNEMCEMYLGGDPKLLGVTGCVIDDLTITLGNKGFPMGDWDCVDTDHDPSTPCERVCDEKPACGKDFGCNSTIQNAYDYCLTQGPVDSILGNNIRYKVQGDGFPFINIPNGRRLLQYTYDMEQINSAFAIKYGEDSSGIKVRMLRTLYDANECMGTCTYGQNLKTRPDEMTFDPIDPLGTGLKDYISLETKNPYSIVYDDGGTNLIPVSSERKNVSRSELYYFIPHIGNIPIMLERISTYLSNESNEDTSKNFWDWLFQYIPLPIFNNDKLKDVTPLTCEEEKGQKDCLYLDSMPNIIVTPPPVTIIGGDGIDVSYYQLNIDWQKVKDSGINFAIIKATEGTSWVDPKFAYNWREAKAKGIPRSAYHFYIPDFNGVEQAQFYVNTLRANGGLDQDFELSVDVEVHFRYPVKNKGQSTSNLLAMLKELERLTGQRPMVYTGLGAWDAMTTHPSWASDYKLWVAHYPGGADGCTPGPGKPLLPVGWTKWVIWQCTSSGTVPGITTRVDLDVAFESAGTGTGTPTVSPLPSVSISPPVPSVPPFGNTRMTDHDTLREYLAANIYTPNFTTLYDSSVFPKGPGVTYWPPEPTNTPGPSQPPISQPPITPIVIDGDCPIVKGDKTSPALRCSQGPDSNSSCSHAGGLMALDIAEHSGNYAVAPENGTVSFYNDGDSGYSCVRCGGKCLATVTFNGDSGTVYKFGHTYLSGVSNGSSVQKGTIIGVAIVGASRCSSGTHIHFEILVGGSAIPSVESEYENMCGQLYYENNSHGCDKSCLK